jgi:hypothetical protein
MQVTGDVVATSYDTSYDTDGVVRSWVTGYDKAGERYEFTRPHAFGRRLTLAEMREFLHAPHHHHHWNLPDGRNIDSNDLLEEVLRRAR